MLEALNLKNNAETRYRCQVSVYRTIGPLVLICQLFMTWGQTISILHVFSVRNHFYLTVQVFLPINFYFYFPPSPKIFTKKSCKLINKKMLALLFYFMEDMGFHCKRSMVFVEACTTLCYLFELRHEKTCICVKTKAQISCCGCTAWFVSDLVENPKTDFLMTWLKFN